MIRWQTIRDSGTEWYRQAGRGEPLRMLIGGVLIFIAFILLLIPLVILGVVVLVISGVSRIVRALAGSAANVLPRDDGRRNVRVRSADDSNSPVR